MFLPVVLEQIIIEYDPEYEWFFIYSHHSVVALNPFDEVQFPMLRRIVHHQSIVYNARTLQCLIREIDWFLRQNNMSDSIGALKGLLWSTIHNKWFFLLLVCATEWMVALLTKWPYLTRRCTTPEGIMWILRKGGEVCSLSDPKRLRIRWHDYILPHLRHWTSNYFLDWPQLLEGLTVLTS